MSKFKAGDRVFWDGGGCTRYASVGTVTRIEDQKVWAMWEDSNVEQYIHEDALTLLEAAVPSQTTTEALTPQQTKYSREIKPGVFVDVYDVLQAFKVTDPSLQHLIKKALAVGQRGHKSVKEDLEDIQASAKRALEMFNEWDSE